MKNNKNNKLFDNEVSENISNTINQIAKYKIIYDDIKGNLNELDAFDYNTNYKTLGQKETSKIEDIPNPNDKNLKHKNSNKLKDKYKNLIKQKRQNFMEKIQNNKEMTSVIESDDNKNDNEKNNDKIICLFCTNLIDLNSFEESFGKMGFIYKDYFYKNCFKSSIRNEFKRISSGGLEEKNIIYSKIKENKKKEDISIRILSCGHYFHLKCFEENGFGYIKCPVCLKIGNILIPPLTIFYGKNQYLKPEKLDNIFNKDNNIQKLEVNKDNLLFKEINIHFLLSIVDKKINLDSISDFRKIVEELFLNYQYYLNYVWNIFYSESTTFFRHEQVDNIQNVLLIIRYMIKINYIDINQVINYIKDEINIVIKGPNEKENVVEKFKEMYYSNVIDKIIFLLLVLTDYDDFQKIFIYILNWALPYLCIWIYLRKIIIDNNFYSIFDDKSKENWHQ